MIKIVNTFSCLLNTSNSVEEEYITWIPVRQNIAGMVPSRYTVVVHTPLHVWNTLYPYKRYSATVLATLPICQTQTPNDKTRWYRFKKCSFLSFSKDISMKRPLSPSPLCSMLILDRLMSSRHAPLLHFSAQHWNRGYRGVSIGPFCKT